MFIFIRLLLAHFIGDFVFQTNKIYNLKSKGLKGVLPHILIITFFHVLFVFPFLNLAVTCWVIVFLSMTHFVQDWLKENVFKFTGSLWIYLADQILHVLAIMIVFITPLKSITNVSCQSNILTSLYNSNQLILFLIAVLFVSYNGFYMIMFFKKTILNIKDNYTFSTKWFGMLERIVIILFTLKFQVTYAVILIGFLLVRIFSKKLLNEKVNPDKQLSSILGTILSWSLGLSTGLMLNIAINSI